MNLDKREKLIIEHIESGYFVLNKDIGDLCGDKDCNSCIFHWNNEKCRLFPFRINSDKNKFIRVLYPECFI